MSFYDGVGWGVQGGWLDHGQRLLFGTKASDASGGED